MRDVLTAGAKTDDVLTAVLHLLVVVVVYQAEAGAADPIFGGDYFPASHL